MIPKISIVIPSFNQGYLIEETIQSILGQNYPSLELMVIDGGSTDQTIDVIRKYDQSLSWWVSEPDNGQAHAINKGLSRATGELFTWINSDDLLAPDALAVVSALYQSGAKTIAGTVINFSAEKETLVVQKDLSAQNLLLDQAVFHQPGFWTATEQVRKTGFFPEEYRYCFDQAFFIRYLALFPNVTYTNRVLAKFRVHEGSKTTSQPLAMHREFIRIRAHAIQGEFKHLKPLLDRKIEDKTWYRVIYLVSQHCEISRFRKSLLLLTLFFIKKYARFNRFFAGSLKKLLVNHD
ncbi:MAG: glycosyltransferase [Bacteroidetes bacterium]|nr:glycosyltransferase [Bacteroidota bacterium]